MFVRFLCILLLGVLIGCTPDSNEPAGENRGGQEVRSAPGECIVEESWLNLQYDQTPDYSNRDISTDFFLLVYSHSPLFCKEQRRQSREGRVPFQCSSPNVFGWVIHGLWGESEAAYLNHDNDMHPRYCKGDLATLPLETIKPYLCMMPGTRLLQGEWEKHGACDFDSAQEYFLKTKQLFEQFKIPSTDLKAGEAIQWMKKNNPELKNKWLHRSGNEFGICFTKDFQVMSCPRRF